MSQFRILGALEIANKNGLTVPSAPKLRAVLVFLLLRANSVVAAEAIFEELWGANPPKSAVTTTQTYIYQLRKWLERESLAPAGDQLLATRAPGYVLRIRPDQLDANVFARLVREGRELLAENRPGEAAQVLRSALGMWTGTALADIITGPYLQSHAAHLEELRVQARELCIEAELQLGLHRELIPELRILVATHPLNEWFHARLIQALCLSGRRGDALAAYQCVRELLSRELGLDPSPELVQIQYEVLSGSQLSMSGRKAG